MQGQDRARAKPHGAWYIMQYSSLPPRPPGRPPLGINKVRVREIKKFEAYSKAKDEEISILCANVENSQRSWVGWNRNKKKFKRLIKLEWVKVSRAIWKIAFLQDGVSAFDNLARFYTHWHLDPLKTQRANLHRREATQVQLAPMRQTLFSSKPLFTNNTSEPKPAAGKPQVHAAGPLAEKAFPA